MNPDVEASPDHRFTIGLVAGTLLGAGLALWLGPGVTAGFRRADEAAGSAAGSDRRGPGSRALPRHA